MAKTLPSDIEIAYQTCEHLVHTHYENFPVASWFLPKKIRRSIAAIYAFARTADDIVDEGNLTLAVRLQRLSEYRQSLKDLTQGISATDPIFIALSDILKNNPQLPITLFFDLLDAFKQDITKTTYANFKEILDYCRCSANPIGRLLLYLTNQATEENLENSDAICTALQLINFLQDLSSDLHKRHRCYLPTDEMIKFNISLEALKAGVETENIQDFIRVQLYRTQALLASGSALGKRLPGLFGFEIRLIIKGGEQMIDALINRKSIYTRSTLTFWQWPKIVWQSF